MLELEVGTLIAPEYERRVLAASSGCIQGIGGGICNSQVEVDALNALKYERRVLAASSS